MTAITPHNPNDTTDYRHLPRVTFEAKDGATLDLQVIDAHRSEGRVARYSIVVNNGGTINTYRAVKSDWAAIVLADHMGWQQIETHAFLSTLYASAVYLTRVVDRCHKNVN